ncbi:MAG: hypothetical protein QNL04_04725, partial [SAR324 cluster bacterium]|nr:hypothetical protein [SAR324 cluster bacterium]
MKEQKQFKWFSFDIVNQAKGVEKVETPSIQRVLINFLITLVVVSIFFLFGWRHLAFLAGSITVVITLGGVASETIRHKIHWFFTKFGFWVTRLIQPTLLLPFLWLLFPFLRLSNFLLGFDPMGRKLARGNSAWIHRKPDQISNNPFVPYSKEYFAPSVNFSKVMVAQLVFVFIIALIGEISFRWMGYGHPVLYVAPAN